MTNFKTWLNVKESEMASSATGTNCIAVVPKLLGYLPKKKKSSEKEKS